MARVFILEMDPVLAAVLEDRLHVAGHRVTLLTDAAHAVSAASGGQCDLVILSMELEVVPGIEVVRGLRGQPETRAVPILALSASSDRSARVEALRAGVDEYLEKPVDMEELAIRVDRLLGNRGATPAVLSGDLASHPIWELVQYVQQAGKSGELVVHGQRGSGQMKVRLGRVMGARFQKLQGRDAVLAILDMKEGNFRLTTGDLPVGESDGDGFPIPEVLMQAAWLEDQLKRRKEFLPATGAPLEARLATAPVMEDEELATVPVAKVFDHILAQNGARIYDLLTEVDEAPPKIRLAVAWLVEQNAVMPSDTQTILNTKEISSSVVLDVAIHNLLAAAKDSGLDTSDLPYLVLMEPEVWPQFKEQLESLPGFRRIEPLTRLVGQVDRRRGGSASFRTEYGTLSLHLQILNSAVKAQVDGIVSVCSGVMVWFEGTEERDLIATVVGRLEAGRAVGILVATTGEAQDLAQELVAEAEHWRMSKHAPRSLIGILRLLHPRSL